MLNKVFKMLKKLRKMISAHVKPNVKQEIK